MDIGVAVRTERLAVVAENPFSIRQFFNSFSKAQKARMSSSSVIQHIQQTVASVELLSYFNQLRELVEKHDPGLENFLRAQGLKAERGVGWRTALKKCLADSLQISTVALQNKWNLRSHRTVRGWSYWSSLRGLPGSKSNPAVERWGLSLTTLG